MSLGAAGAGGPRWCMGLADRPWVGGLGGAAGRASGRPRDGWPPGGSGQGRSVPEQATRRPSPAPRRGGRGPESRGLAPGPLHFRSSLTPLLSNVSLAQRGANDMVWLGHGKGWAPGKTGKINGATVYAAGKKPNWEAAAHRCQTHPTSNAFCIAGLWDYHTSRKVGTLGGNGVQTSRCRYTQIIVEN